MQRKNVRQRVAAKQRTERQAGGEWVIPCGGQSGRALAQHSHGPVDIGKLSSLYALR